MNFDQLKQHKILLNLLILKKNIFELLLLLYDIKPAKNEINVWDNLNEPPPFKNGFCILNWYTSRDGKTPNRNTHIIIVK
jgi:hypothetical protein